MRRRIWTGTAAAVIGVAAATTLIAQTATTHTQTQSGDVIVTGCLRAAAATISAESAPVPGATGTTGATDAAATPTGTAGTAAPADEIAVLMFVLMDAAPAGDTSAGGTNGNAASRRHDYRLIANPAALLPHVGKKVELAGTIEDSDSDDTLPRVGPNLPTLRVESGRIVAPSCDEQQA